MRVIAGSAKGIRLAPVPEGVRPLADRAREGLFSSLGAAVSGARVLDLYAGTGAMGIEALSRGAEHATFVERDARAAAAIHENLERARVAERATVRTDAVDRVLAAVAPTPFDLVLADPPYAADLQELASTLASLASGWLGADGAIVVLTRGVRSSMPVIPLDWVAARDLRYGDCRLLQYRCDDREA